MQLRRAALAALLFIGCKKEPSSAPQSQASGEPPAGPAAPPAGSGSATGSATAPAPSGATRTVGPFTEVHVGNALEADIDIGPAAPLQLTGDPAIVPLVITKVVASATGNVLDISLPDGRHEMKERIKIHITMPALTAIEAGTSSVLVGNGITEDTFDAKVTTSAQVTLKGTCRVLAATAETSAKLDASGLECEEVKVSAATAADAKINALASATGSAATAARVHVTGNPKTKDIKTSTAATVD